MTNAEYLKECRRLSLTARACVALLVCDKYSSAHQFRTNDTDTFFEYLWEWPVVNDFDSWEQQRPFLVNFALGDEATEELIEEIKSAGIEESVFRTIISGPVEILWGSFWGAAEDDLSLTDLNNTIEASRLPTLPILTPFKFSRFDTNDGWGEQLSKQDRDFWRESARYA